MDVHLQPLHDVRFAHFFSTRAVGRARSADRSRFQDPHLLHTIPQGDFAHGEDTGEII